MNKNLEKFIDKNPPKKIIRKSNLHLYYDDILYLISNDYTIKQVQEYLIGIGESVKYNNLYRYVKSNVKIENIEKPQNQTSTANTKPNLQEIMNSKLRGS